MLNYYNYQFYQCSKDEIEYLPLSEDCYGDYFPLWFNDYFIWHEPDDITCGCKSCLAFDDYIDELDEYDKRVNDYPIRRGKYYTEY